MDTSETYVKMCEKAVEIQREWKPTYDYHDYSIIDHSKQTFDPLFLIWLPRQDQLQEMVGCTAGSWKIILSKLMDSEYFYSLEQSWLAFVMKNKYNKTWNGEDWV